ncbi:MAG: tetratricopeptide repeat protein [Planctomycetota bacterium]
MKRSNSDSLHGFTMGIDKRSSAILLGLMLQAGLVRAQMQGTQALSQPPDQIWIQSLVQTGAASLAMDVCTSRTDLCMPGSNAHAQWRMLGLHAQTVVSLEKIDWNSPFDGLSAIQNQLVISPSTKRSTPTNSDAQGARDPWIRWKKLWCLRLMQQHSLAAYLAVPSRKEHQQWLLQSIRLGLDELEELEQAVLKMEPDKPILTKSQRETKDKTLPNEVTAAEILDLKGELELLRIDMLYQRSQCYPYGSDEQISAATQMLSSIDRASSQLPATWTNRPLLNLAQAEAQLQLGRHPAVQKSLDELWNSLGNSLSSEAKTWQQSAACMAIRSARMTQNWELADAWFARVGDWKNSPELAIENLAMMVDRKQERSVEPADILSMRKAISERFGKYWEQRVDALLVSADSSKLSEQAGVGNSMSSLELFRIQARQALAAKRFQEAIEKLQQAELAASKSGKTLEAFQFALQIAAVLEQMQQPSASADEFYRAAISYPETPKAPDAALMSAWLIRNPESPLDIESQANRLATYLQRLKETALVWPQSEPANKSIQMLETRWLGSGDFIAMMDFWSDYLAKEPKGLQQATARWLLGALVTQEDWLEGSVTDSPKLNKSITRLQESILQAAKSQEPSELNSSATQQALLEWINVHQPDRRWHRDSDSWQPLVDSDDWLGQLASTWNRCETAWQNGSLSQPMLQELLAQRQLAMDRGVGTSPQGTLRLDRFVDLAQIEMQAMDSGQLKRDLQERIAKEPKSLWWVYRSARTMQRTDGLSEDSLGWYRQMANGVKPGSEPWLEARARSIQVLESLGDSVKAKQLRDLVVAFFPDLPSKWQSRLGVR